MKRVLWVVCCMLVLFSLCFISCSDNKTAAGTGVQEDRELVVAVTTEPKFFNNISPTGSTDYDNVVFNNIYDALLKRNSDGTVVPYLAESYEMSPDGLQIKIKLRDNVFFHDGTKLTTEDLKFSYETNKTLPTGSILLVNLDYVEIVDELNCIIHMTNPYVAILNALCSRSSPISSKAYWEKVGGYAGYSAKPIGTGPYKFVSATSGDSIVLERNDNYWGGKPAFKKATIKVIPDNNTAILAVESGDADVALGIPLDSLININNPDVVWDSSSANACNLFIFNFVDGCWTQGDKNFRKAVQHAINPAVVNEGLYYGRAVQLDMYGDPSYSARPPAGTYTPQVYDIEKAKAYLEASNYDGREFRVITWAGSTVEKIAQIMQAQLQEIGINMRVIATDNPTYYDIRNKADFDARLWPQSTGVLDMDAYGMFLESVKDAPENTRWPSHQRTQELVLAGRTEPDNNKRIEIYRELANLIAEEAIHVYTTMEVNTVLYNKDIKGVKAELVKYHRFFDWSY